jgi:NADH-quinone oxidoreductase subunit N
LSCYLIIKLQSLEFYVITTLKKDSKIFTKVGLKYFILGPFAYAIILFGCYMMYGFIGITNFKELTRIFIGYKIFLLGVQSSGIFKEFYLLL